MAGSRTRKKTDRLTAGRDFPWLTGDNVGDLLVFIPSGDRQFQAYVLDTEEDIDDIQAALGVEIVGTWGLYDAESVPPEDPSQCVDRLFREYAKTLTDVPSTIDFSQKTLEVLYHCIKDFGAIPNDDRLLQGLEEEYRLFQMAERLLCQNRINGVFRSVDDFLETAQSILQRRKARAGRSFENHVAHLLTIEKILFSEQPVVDGRPEFGRQTAHFQDFWQQFKVHYVTFDRLTTPGLYPELVSEIGSWIDTEPNARIIRPFPKNRRWMVYTFKALTRLLGRHSPIINTTIAFAKKK